MKRLALFLFVLTSHLACGPGPTNDRVALKKLRALGVASSPLIAKPTSLVTLSVYAVVPLSDEITYETFEDEASVLAPTIKSLTFLDASVDYKDLAKFRLFKVDAQFIVPNNDILKLKDNDATRFRYAIQLKSPGEEERIVGDVIVRPEGAEELAWKAPGCDIIGPVEDSVIKRKHKVDIAAEVENYNDEELKVGWYTSNGDIENRRSESTTWTTGSQDTQTLILTVRGKQSRGFCLDVAEFDTK